MTNLMELIPALFFYHTSNYTKRKKLLMRYLRFRYRLLLRYSHEPSIYVLTLLKGIAYIVDRKGGDV